MGSRFRGYIEPRSMPALHRYFGTPLTTWILNVLYSTDFSDIHCGMRGITRDALVRIELESQSWEYASEMVLKAVCLDLPSTEVPVRFLKDPAGRLSHMKRNGWREPWRAGWINLRAMLLFGADFFLLRPGLALLALGLLLTVPVCLGPLPLGPVTLSLHWMLLGLTLSVVGLECFYLGCIVQVMYRYSAARAQRWLRLFAYDRAMLAAGLACLAGFALGLPLVHEYLSGGLRLPVVPGRPMYLAVLGLLFVIAAFHTFGCTLVLHAANLRTTTYRAATTYRGAPSGSGPKNPMNDHILVTGGAGCIGSDLAAALLERGDRVTVIDNLGSGKYEHIEALLPLPGFRFIEGDLLDPAALETAMEGVSMVYHLAANPDVKFIPGDPTDKDLQQNTICTYLVLEEHAPPRRAPAGLLFDLRHLRHQRASAHTGGPAAPSHLALRRHQTELRGHDRSVPAPVRPGLLDLSFRQHRRTKSSQARPHRHRRLHPQAPARSHPPPDTRQREAGQVVPAVRGVRRGHVIRSRPY